MTAPCGIERKKGMISNEDIKDIGKRMAGEWKDLRVRDIAFAALCAIFVDKRIAARIAYGEREAKEGERMASETRVVSLVSVLRQYGVGMTEVDEGSISKEENRAELVKMLDEIDRQMQMGQIAPKDALSLKKDIRVKLQDKFEIENVEQAQRIIVVPQKRDMVCPHTNRECTYWPTKEACMEHFGLNEL